MATSTVGSTGDYATLSAWQTAVQGTSDATETAQMQDESHGTSGVTLSGWTNDPHVVIEGAVAQDGDITSGPRFVGQAVIIQDQDAGIDLTLRDLSHDMQGGFYICLLQTGTGFKDAGTTLTVENCLMVQSTGAELGNKGLHIQYRTAVVTNQITVNVDNCVFGGIDDSAGGAVYLENGNSVNVDMTLRGCTFHESRPLYVQDNDVNDLIDITAVGCLFDQGAGNADDIQFQGSNSGSYTYTSTSNITTNTSATHSANWGTVTNLLDSVTFNDSGTPGAGEVSFTDAVNDDYSIVDNANNAALGHVTSGSMPTTDILGTTRDANPDAGAFEVVTSGASGTGAFTTPLATMAGAGAAVGEAVQSGTGAFTAPIPVMSSAGARLSSGTSFRISTMIVPTATDGVAYSETMAVQNAGGTVVWSFAAGKLPPGLTMTTGGVISGTPTSPGAYRVTLQAFDGTSTATADRIVAVESASGTVPVVSVAPSQTTNWAPMGTFVSGKATTMTGVSEPWRDLVFWWEWADDANERNIVTRGCFSGHTYREPGTYNARVTVTKPWTRETTVQTVTFTVTDQDAEFPGTSTVCVSTSGTFTDAPAGADTVTSSDATAVLNTHAASGKRVLFRYGEEFGCTANWSESGATDMMIGAFGTPGTRDERGIADNAPVIKPVGVSSGFNVWTIQSGTSVVVQDIHMDLSANGGIFNGMSWTRQCVNVLTDRFKVSPITNVTAALVVDFQTALVQSVAPTQGAVISDCELNSEISLCLWGGADKFAVIGNRVYSDDNHGIRFSCCIGLAIWGNDVESNRIARHAIKIHGEDSTRPGGAFEGIANSFWTEDIHIADNTLTGVCNWLFTFTKQNAVAGYEEWQRRMVCEGNTFKATGNELQQFIRIGSPECDVFNNVWKIDGADTYAVTGALFMKYGDSPAAEDCRTWNNTVARASGSNSSTTVIDADATYVGTLPIWGTLQELEGSTSYATSAGTVTDTDALQTASPGWTNEAGDDYTLTAGSPAVDNGTTQPPIDIDYDGIYRDATPDAGAFERYVVDAAVGGGGPTITTTTLPDAYQSVAYSQTLQQTGGAGPFTWTVTVGSLPAGLTLNPSTGAITGTPTSSGTSNFTVQVVDSNTDTDTQALSLEVVASPTITTTTMPNATEGSGYSEALAATGGLPPYMWALAAGPLPAGLTLTTGGVLTGTPTESGSFPFTAQITDGNGLVQQSGVSLTVDVAPPSVTITTTSLPSVSSGSAYSETLVASGGQTPYVWSLLSGTLPTGLSLSSGGVISGTAGGSGASNFTVRVTDDNLVTDDQALSITVTIPSSSEAPPNGNPFQPGAWTLGL